MDQKRHRRTTQLPLELGMNLGGGGRKPPGRGGRAAGAGLPRKPSLTETFNKAAKQPKLSSVVKQPVSKQQIEDLRRKMSQPKPSCDFCPLGRANVARNPAKDRKLMETMTALTARLNKNKGLSQKFGLAARKGDLKRQFNKQSLGRGL